MRETEIRAGICPYCGYENPSGSRFCLGCGRRILTNAGDRVGVPSVSLQDQNPNSVSLIGRISKPVDLSHIPRQATIAGTFAFLAAGAWTIAALISISLGGLALVIGVWNLGVCAAIVLVALQLLKCNADFRGYAIGLFPVNVFAMGLQMMFLAIEIEPTILMFDVLGLIALGVQAWVLMTEKDTIRTWHNAKLQVAKRRTGTPKRAKPAQVEVRMPGEGAPMIREPDTVIRVCPNCGQTLPAEMRFCMHCGTPL